MTEAPALPAETPFRVESAPDPVGLDVLSDVLRVFHTSGAALLRGEFAEPWTLDMPHGNDFAAMLHSRQSRVIMFHIVAEGGCWVDVDGEPRVWLGKGDMIGFPLGHQHFMGAGERGNGIRLSTTLPPPPWIGMPIVRLGSGGAQTQMICVYLHCDKLLFNPILESLPVTIVVRPKKEAGHWIDATLHYIIAESLSGSQGSNGVIARLTELLFVEILRQHMTELRRDTGWLAALGDRHMAKALQALHGNPRHRWTVAELSAHVGMSRSALAARFHHFLSQAPMSYLARWRFQLAAQTLKNGDKAVAHVAAEIGYESEEAFSRAFRRHAGVTPTEWRRESSSAAS
jgi:AraC family transcriptional regulator, alkane utilization regulator